MDTKRQQPLAMALRLKGRVNYSTDRADSTYLLNTDAAAAIVAEIMGLVTRAGAMAEEHGQRFAAEFGADVEQRLREMP